jgi:hypothetical protein
MKKYMMMIFYGLIVLVAVLLVVGLVLPRQRTFYKEAVLRAAPADVFAVVTDVQAQATWRSDLLQVEMLPDGSWKEIPKRGPALHFRERRKVPAMVFEIEMMPTSGFQGYWTGHFSAGPDGTTRVKFTEVVELPQLFGRLFSYLFVNLDKTMDQYLADLRKVVEKK